MPVDSFRFLPRLIAMFYRMTEIEALGEIPWTALEKPLSACKLGLVTSGGLYQKGVEAAFDLARERAEPTWGDPGFRTLPADIRAEEVGISHLHVNPAPVQQDINVLLPLDRVRTLVDEGSLGAMAQKHFSVMGYQGFPPNTQAWQQTTGPEIARRFLAQEVDCILLTPT